MKWNKIICKNGRSLGARSVAQAPAWKACCSVSRLPPAAFCRLQAAPADYTRQMLWLAATLCLMHIPTWNAKIIIVVKFEEINLKFKKVRKSSRYNKVRKSSRSTCNHDCYRKTLSSLNIVTLLNFMQYNTVQQGSARPKKRVFRVRSDECYWKTAECWMRNGQKVFS